MLDLKTALRQGVEVHRRLTMPPQKETESASTRPVAEATLFAPPKTVAPITDDLTPPAAAAPETDKLELPRQPEITFESEPPSPTLTPQTVNPAEQLEQSLRQSLRRYASIRRQEELL